jgi:hypothetical protein
MRRLSKNVQQELLKEMRLSLIHSVEAYSIMWGNQRVSKELDRIVADYWTKPTRRKRPRK